MPLALCGSCGAEARDKKFLCRPVEPRCFFKTCFVGWVAFPALGVAGTIFVILANVFHGVIRAFPHKPAAVAGGFCDERL